MEDAQIAAWREIDGLVHGFGRRGSALPAHGLLWLLKQVHGAALVTPPWDAPPTADAAGAEAPGDRIGIQTADCLPILFADPMRRLVAAAHAGWRGTALQIGVTAIDWLVARGSRVEDLRVALGPCIGACCYEVGDELRAQFAAEDQPFFVVAGGPQPHLDVRGINERQLLARGVRQANIAHVAECTRCHPELYHSYRRDGATGGRMISWVGWD
jgi:YfiH family protein